VSDLWGLLLDIVHWAGRTADRVVDGLGMDGGSLDGFVGWLAAEADWLFAGILAAIIVALWAMLMAGLASWVDRRVRARVEGRLGPRYRGPGGILQGLADWVKLMLRSKAGMPSAAAAALSGALVLGALALLPLCVWVRLVDPGWGVMVAAGLCALSPLPIAAVAPAGSRHAEAAEAAGTGVVLMLAVAASTLIAGEGSATGLVAAQSDWGWGIVLAPLGFLLFLLVMYWEAGRLERARRTSARPEGWPGPHRAIARFAVATRYYTLGILGAIVFLGGWSGPVHDGFHWTLLKAFALMAVASLLSGAMPAARPRETAVSVRNRWLPVAALNLVVVSAILEVVA
jgi:NADH-quinone oxidoreductase subunit H